jgi:hypothetical protein
MLGLSFLVGDLAAGENVPDKPARPPSRAGEGTFANSFPVLRALVQKPEDPSVNCLIISCGQSCQLVKSIRICRKLQKLSNQFCWKLEIKLYNFY